MAVDKKYEFCIKSPKWHRNTFFVLVGMGVVGSILMLILWLTIGFDWGILVGALMIFAIELLIGGLGLFVWYREEFCFQDGVFTYVAAFSKKKTANIADVARVEFSTAYAFPRLTFVDKNGKILLRFSDDGTSLKKNHLVGLLMHYDIPIVKR
ncbi:MAG: hypothetical protein IJ308_04790 [Clostridia bacterium]|nr:hypothetical protein [Clostridia bacterium]